MDPFFLLCTFFSISGCGGEIFWDGIVNNHLVVCCRGATSIHPSPAGPTPPRSFQTLRSTMMKVRMGMAGVGRMC